MRVTDDADAIGLARRIAETELSPRSRIAHGALLAAALAMTVVVVALWATEPSLPARAQAAFGVMAVIGAIWSGYSAWVLTQRRVLFARQRVIAGWLAVLFTTIFTMGAFATAVAADTPAGFAAGALGMVLIAASVLLLLRARGRWLKLQDRKREHEAFRAGAGR